MMKRELWDSRVFGAACALAVILPVATLAVSGRRQAVFRAGVDAVVVDVSVTTQNRPVPGLTAADFEIADNGVRQAILDVGYETMPIDLTLILDRTGNGPLSSSLARAVNTVRDHLRSDDRVALLTFDQRVTLRVPLGPAAALPVLQQGSITYVGVPSASTALFDALTIGLIAPSAPGRRKMAILFTSGPDAISFSDEASAIDVAQRAATAVFVFASTVNPRPLPMSAPGDHPKARPGSRAEPRDVMFASKPLPSSFLRKLADTTGGLFQTIEPVVYLANDPMHVATRRTDETLEAPFLRALDSFRASYSLRFTPQGVSPTGWHELKVRVTKTGVTYQVRARKGYASRGPFLDVRRPSR